MQPSSPEAELLTCFASIGLMDWTNIRGLDQYYSLSDRDARFPNAVCAPLRRLHASRDAGQGAHAGIAILAAADVRPAEAQGQPNVHLTTYLFMDSHNCCRPGSGRGRRRSWRPRTRASPKQRASPMCTCCPALSSWKQAARRASSCGWLTAALRQQCSAWALHRWVRTGKTSTGSAATPRRA